MEQTLHQDISRPTPGVRLWPPSGGEEQREPSPESEARNPRRSWSVISSASLGRKWSLNIAVQKTSPICQSDVAGGGRSICRLGAWPTGPTENQTTVPKGNRNAKKRQKESASQSSKAGYDSGGIRHIGPLCKGISMEKWPKVEINQQTSVHRWLSSLFRERVAEEPSNQSSIGIIMQGHHQPNHHRLISPCLGWLVSPLLVCPLYLIYPILSWLTSPTWFASRTPATPKKKHISPYLENQLVDLPQQFPFPKPKVGWCLHAMPQGACNSSWLAPWCPWNHHLSMR